MEKRNEELEQKIDRQEQCFRCNCILILQYLKSNEITDNVVVQTITELLDINVIEDDLDQSHLLEKRSTNQNKFRSIIVKLAKCHMQRNIFITKRNLRIRKSGFLMNLLYTKMAATKLQIIMIKI